MVGGAPLDGGGNDLPALFLCLVLQLLLDLLDLHSGFVTDVVFNALEQILLCLVLGQPGELLQRFQLLGLQFLGLRLGLGQGGHASVQFLFLLLEGLGLTVQGCFLLLKPAFLFGQFSTALFDFAVVFCAGFMDLVLGLQKHFLFPVFTVSDGFIDQTGGLFLGRADLPFCHLLPIGNTDGKTGGASHQNAQNDQ